MAKNNNLTDFVRDLADGFREKLGWPSRDKINPQDFRDFIDNSPSVGTLTTGLESLNWERTITHDDEQIYCPVLPKEIYFDESTKTPLLPLIRFQFTVLDPLESDERIVFYDDAVMDTFVLLDATNTTGSYILPVFAGLENANIANFTPIHMTAINIRAAGVRLKMEASWVQIGSAQYPMFLSAATMRGYK